MKTILITGANGFVGSHIVDKALTEGMKVYAGVRTSSNLTYLEGKNVELIFLNYDNLNELIASLNNLKHLDLVIHNAGVTSAIDESLYDLVNNQYTRNIISAFASSQLKIDRFVYISSLAAIGSKDFDPSIPISDEDLPNPITAYGTSKLMAETFLCERNLLPFTIIRPTAIYGPRDKEFKTLFKTINIGLEIYLGYQKSKLSFIHVLDLVDAVFIASNSHQAINKSYIVSDGNNYSAEELNQYIKESLERKWTIKLKIPKQLLLILAYVCKLIKLEHLINKDKISILTAKNWQANSSEIQSLGFNANFSLKEGIAHTATYLKT